MNNLNTESANNLTSKWILLGIPVLIVIGFPMHYIYEWSGKFTVIGIFAPTNESVWEHLKLTFWPMLLWWLVIYFVLRKNNKISYAQWFFSCAVSELICPLVIVVFFYTYTGAFGIESLILDIFSLILGVAIGQGLALHVYKFAILRSYCLYIAIAVLALLAIIFTVYTFATPHIPIFLDSSSGRYGI